jgi:hypothetical protein
VELSIIIIIIIIVISIVISDCSPLLGRDRFLRFLVLYTVGDRLWGLMVRVRGSRSGGPGLIPGASRFSEK